MRALWLALLLAACAPRTVEVPVTVLVPQTVEAPATVEVVREVEVTRQVEVTRLVESSPAPTATLAGLDGVFYDLETAGGLVTENYDWGPCPKAVFVWDLQGRGHVAVWLWAITEDRRSLLVNEVAPANGETLAPIAGGEYFLEVDTTGVDVSIRGECR